MMINMLSLVINDDEYIIKIPEDEMYNIIFYRGKNGFGELLGFIDDLNNKATTSKNERIMLKQIRFYITSSKN